jgi:hypothetical protein
MARGSTRGAWWTVGRSRLRQQTVAAGVWGVLVSGLVALLTHLMSVAGPAIPGIPIPGHIGVSPLEWFLFGILMTTGICISWPVARRITTRRVMTAVAVVGVLFATIPRRWDLEGKHRFHSDRATDARLAGMNRILERHGFQPTGGCLVLVDPSVESDPWVQRWRRLHAYHQAQAQKYAFATSHSWLPVAPDPRPPQ